MGEYVRKELERERATTQVSPHELANAMEEIKVRQRVAEEAERRAREAGSPILTWAKKNQKLLLWIFLGGGGTSGAYATVRGELQAQAEAAVLERQAEEAQAESVKLNTAAIVDGADATHDLADRVDDLDHKVDANADLMRTAIEVQLAQPGTKKALKARPELAKKAEEAIKLPEPP
jgi:hypothetical protein